MFDPFGLKKESEEGSRSPEGAIGRAVEAASLAAPRPEFTGPGASSGPSAKVLAAFLVVDSVFVIVFGGTLAAKLYEHFTAPVPVLRPAPTPRKPKPDIPPPETPAVDDAAAVSTPKAVGETAESAPPAEAPNAPPPVGPSAPPAEPAPEAVPAKPKAVPVEFKLKHSGAHKVELAGAFIVRGGKVPMTRNGDGTWDVTLYLTPDTYRYHFLVDGKKLMDPQNPNVVRGSSVITVP